MGSAATDMGLSALSEALEGHLGGVPPGGGAPHGTGVPPGVTGGAPALRTGGGVLGPIGHGAGPCVLDLGGVPGGLLVTGRGGDFGPNSVSAGVAVSPDEGAGRNDSSAGSVLSPAGALDGAGGTVALANSDTTSNWPDALITARRTAPSISTSTALPGIISSVGEDSRLRAETSEGSDSQTGR